jgi:hypothetical protein
MYVAFANDGGIVSVSGTFDVSSIDTTFNNCSALGSSQSSRACYLVIDSNVEDPPRSRKIPEQRAKSTFLDCDPLPVK